MIKKHGRGCNLPTNFYEYNNWNYTYVEDLESCNVEHANEHSSLLASLQSDIAHLDQPLEAPVEETLS